MPESTRHVHAQGKSSDLLAIYERLLDLYREQLRVEEVNPYQSILSLFLRCLNPAFLIRLWNQGARFLKTPNTLAQDLVGGSVVLRELEAFDDQILRGVAECNRINLRRLLRRSVFGWLPKLTGASAVLLALPKAFKEGLGVDILAILPPWVPSLAPAAVNALVGLVLGSIGNLVLSMPRLGLLRALDDLIAIAAAHRGASSKE